MSQPLSEITMRLLAPRAMEKPVSEQTQLGKIAFVASKSPEGQNALNEMKGRYGGVNLSAMIALCLGIAPNVPGFLEATHVLDGERNFSDTLYTFAWFVGFLLAGGIYLALESPRRARSRAS